MHMGHYWQDNGWAIAIVPIPSMHRVPARTVVATYEN